MIFFYGKIIKIGLIFQVKDNLSSLKFSVEQLSDFQ